MFVIFGLYRFVYVILMVYVTAAEVQNKMFLIV